MRFVVLAMRALLTLAAGGLAGLSGYLLLLTGAPANRGKRKIFDENNRLRLADGCVILGREFDRTELKRLVAADSDASDRFTGP